MQLAKLPRVDGTQELAPLGSLSLDPEHTAYPVLADRVRCKHTDLLPANLPTQNLICANLPYIPTKTLKGLDVFGREPTLALDGGPDGLSLIRRLLPLAALSLMR